MYVPPIRNRSPEVFPNKFVTEITSDYFTHLKTFEDKSRKEYFENLTLDAYLADFDKRPSLYDLHEVNFQNFILRVTAGKSNEELIKLSLTTHAYKRIVRGRCYAIASRADLDWFGNPGESKQEALEEIWTSLKLYDWHLAPSDELESIEEKRKSLQLNCEFSTMAVDTQTAIEKFTKRFPGKKIAWLNLANGHNCCGTYNVAFGGSQEEMVASVSTAAATLGLCAQIIDNSFRVKVQKGEHHVVYRHGLHIPPGGNYFSKTKFLLSDPQIDCYMIAAAFADFRYYLPGFTTYTERGDYYSWFGYGSSPKSESELTKRLLIDIEGVCLTAVKEGVEVLVLGAGGCGAFLHSAWRDSKLWKEVLDKYANCFEAVTFAILPDKRRPENVQAFEKFFPILE